MRIVSIPPLGTHAAAAASSPSSAERRAATGVPHAEGRRRRAPASEPLASLASLASLDADIFMSSSDADALRFGTSSAELLRAGWPLVRDRFGGGAGERWANFISCDVLSPSAPSASGPLPWAGSSAAAAASAKWRRAGFFATSGVAETGGAFGCAAAYSSPPSDDEGDLPALRGAAPHAASTSSIERRARATATVTTGVLPKFAALLRRKAEFQRFLTAFSALPGSSSAIFVQALPQRFCASLMIVSSSCVHPPFFRCGSR
mmetsp:Transcript_9323/g.32176  ORF Transcript_9323/g.32176 Transcript_9323/m.32176 type:complete len:262 (-) Transcript_9323:429-1214(-)